MQSSFWQRLDRAISHPSFRSTIFGFVMLSGALGSLVGTKVGDGSIGTLVGIFTGILVGFAIEILRPSK